MVNGSAALSMIRRHRPLSGFPLVLAWAAIVLASLLSWYGLGALTLAASALIGF